MEHRVDQLDPVILEAIREQLGAKNGKDTSKDSIINTMTNQELLNSWLIWEGIIEYTDEIIDVIESIYGISLTKKEYK